MNDQSSWVALVRPPGPRRDQGLVSHIERPARRPAIGDPAAGTCVEDTMVVFRNVAMISRLAKHTQPEPPDRPSRGGIDAPRGRTSGRNRRETLRRADETGREPVPTMVN